MQHSALSSDRSSVFAFITFAAAATVWIGVMAVQPKGEGLRALSIVMTKDIAVVQQPPVLVADLSR